MSICLFRFRVALASAAALLVFFDAAPQAASLPLSAGADGRSGVRFDGAASGDRVGTAVAGGGDINGDGYPDLILGAEHMGSPSIGAAFVRFGGIYGGEGAQTLNPSGSDGFKVTGVTDGGYLGRSVACAGDVNGDGFADVVIGEPGSSGIPGKIHLILGKSSGWPSNITVTSLDGSNGFTYTGVNGDNAGESVAGVGDINDDGYDDIAVGAPYSSSNGTNSGSVYVIYGKAGGWAATQAFSALDGTNGFRMTGGAASDRLGNSVAAAGDANGDGIADLIAGARYHNSSTGRAYLLLGTTTARPPSFTVNTLDGTNGCAFHGNLQLDNTGNSVSSAGDINADGYSDLMVGAERADTYQSDTGAAYVIFGRSTFPSSITLANLNGTDGFILTGSIGGEWLGSGVAGPGDVNGDGYADLLLGATGADLTGAEAGAVYLIYGSGEAWSASQSLAYVETTANAVRWEGLSGSHYAGRIIGAAGDVNGDGLADLLVGQDVSSLSASFSGSVFLMYGTRRHTAVFHRRTEAGDTPRLPFGRWNDARLWLNFDGGTAASTERITLVRSGRDELRNLTPIEDVGRSYWSVFSNRQGWTSCTVTVEYTSADISGISGGEAGLSLFRSPNPTGPWSRLTGTVNTDRNQVSAPTERLGYFAIGATSVPALLTAWEVE